MNAPIINIEFRGKKAVSGLNSTPLIIYVKNANITRAGTASDSEIIESMLSRGYIVVTLDFQNDPKSVQPELDFYVHELREQIWLGEYFKDSSVFPEGKYYNTFVVPSGHSISLNHTFWEIDKHGTYGILESIVQNWNTDFRARKGERTVYWRYPDGKRKETLSSDTDIWLDKNGTPTPNGDYVRVKHTFAKSIVDCVRPDGSQFDMALKMHLIYPVRPKKNVPVMCLSNSTEYLSGGLNTKGRPQMNGFLFGGYAGAVFDHLYQPMAYAVNYGYYDGNIANGGVTGDPASYSLHFFCEKKVTTAAMRYIRYLSLSDHSTYSFDNEKIGVYGNSKGGWMNFLGTEEIRRPTVFDKSKADTLEETIDARINSYHSMRQFTGFPDISRYQAGYRKDETVNGITVRAGELQPCLTYNGKEIPSHANLIYASCGGNTDEMTYGNAPAFISVHLADNFVTLCDMANLARVHNIPSAHFVIDHNHDLARGNDVLHGVDTYRAFMDFSGYHLRGDAVKLFYTEGSDEALSFKFSGSITAAEIEKITVKKDGRLIKGSWTDMYGRTEWTFTPTKAQSGELTFNVPSGFCGENGTPTEKEITGCITLSPRKSNSLKKLEEFESTLDFTSSYESLVSPTETVMTLSHAPDGKEAVSMFIKRGSYKNALTNPTLFTLPEFITGINKGDKITLSLSVYDKKERRITLLLASETNREKRIFDLNECICNLKTKSNEWTELNITHTLTYIPESGYIPFTVKFEYTDGDESPVWFNKIKIKKSI